MKSGPPQSYVFSKHSLALPDSIAQNPRFSIAFDRLTYDRLMFNETALNQSNDARGQPRRPATTFRGVFKRGDHVFPAEIRIALEDSIDRISTANHAQDVSHHDACAADQRCPEQMAGLISTRSIASIVTGSRIATSRPRHCFRRLQTQRSRRWCRCERRLESQHLPLGPAPTRPPAGLRPGQAAIHRDRSSSISERNRCSHESKAAAASLPTRTG